MSAPEEEGEKSRQPYCLTQVDYAVVGSTSSWAALVGICGLGNLKFRVTGLDPGKHSNCDLARPAGGIREYAAIRGRPIR